MKPTQLLNPTDSEKEADITELPQISGALEQLSKFIADGQLKAASKRHASISQKIEAGSHQVTSKDKSRFSELTQKLLELKDWQGFATRPKRIELCEQMEKLSGEAAIAPKEKAKAIKELQDAWRALGASDSKDSQRLWARFKKASDIAYAPCATYFAELKSIRAQNEKTCTEICTQLEEFIAAQTWEAPDWKAISQLLSKAKGDFGKHSEVTGAKRRQKLNARFTKSVDTLRAKINAEQTANQAKKSELIARARVIVDDADEPVSQKIDQIKSLQSEWKTIGITDRRRDQKLWKSFRAQCDRAFEEREQNFKAQKVAAEKAHEAVNHLCKDFKRLIVSGEVDAVALKQFQDNFASQPPELQRGNASKEFKKLTRDARAAIAERAKASHREMLGEVKRKAALCILFENAQIDKAQLDDAWEAEIEISPDIQERLLDRITSASNDSQCSTTNRKLADLLCVRMEILAELESPADAKELRMRYQVERLNKKLSLGEEEQGTPLAQAEEILIDWYCLGKLGTGAGELTERFYRAESKLFGSL